MQCGVVTGTLVPEEEEEEQEEKEEEEEEERKGSEAIRGCFALPVTN